MVIVVAAVRNCSVVVAIVVVVAVELLKLEL